MSTPSGSISRQVTDSVLLGGARDGDIRKPAASTRDQRPSRDAMIEPSRGSFKSRSVGTHYTRYALGNVLALSAGFVSFPILTRVLSNYQFGLIGYLDAVLLLAVATLKYGLGDAVMRFYPHGGAQAEFQRFVASLLLVPMAISGGIWLISMVAVGLAVSAGLIQHGWAVMLALATLPCLTFASYVQWLMAAQERSGVNAGTSTVSKWLQTLLVVTLVLMVIPSVTLVYAGRLLAGLLICLWLGWWLWRHARPRFADADLALTRSAMLYALPLALSEMAAIGYVFIDRLMLKIILGDFTAVGIYTIGASLAIYVGMLVSSTLVQAYAPGMNRIYTQEGAAAVIRFKQRILLPMTYVVVLLVAGLLLTGHDFFVLISGPGKAASAPVFILLSATFVVLALMSVAGYGAVLVKRTRVLLAVNVAGLVFNIALNLVLIPAYGIMGAVYAVMATRPLVNVAIYLTCPSSLRCLPSGRAVLQATGLGIVASVAGWLVLQAMPPNASLLRLTTSGLTLVLCYGIPLLLILPQFRGFTYNWTMRIVGACSPGRRSR